MSFGTFESERVEIEDSGPSQHWSDGASGVFLSELNNDLSNSKNGA